MDHHRSLYEGAVYAVAVLYSLLASYLEPTLHWATLLVGLAGGALLLRYRVLRNRAMELEVRIKEAELRRVEGGE